MQIELNRIKRRFYYCIALLLQLFIYFPCSIAHGQMAQMADSQHTKGLTPSPSKHCSVSKLEKESLLRIIDSQLGHIFTNFSSALANSRSDYKDKLKTDADLRRAIIDFGLGILTMGFLKSTSLILDNIPAKSPDVLYKVAYFAQEAIEKKQLDPLLKSLNKRLSSSIDSSIQGAPNEKIMTFDEFSNELKWSLQNEQKFLIGKTAEMTEDELCLFAAQTAIHPKIITSRVNEIVNAFLDQVMIIGNEDATSEGKHSGFSGGRLGNFRTMVFLYKDHLGKERHALFQAYDVAKCMFYEDGKVCAPLFDHVECEFVRFLDDDFVDFAVRQHNLKFHENVIWLRRNTLIPTNRGRSGVCKTITAQRGSLPSIVPE